MIFSGKVTHKNNTWILTFLLVLASLILVHAEMIQPRRLVDSHTAGVLPRGYFDFEVRFYSANPNYGSGLLLGLSAGLTDRLDIGIMYGGEGLIGRGKHVNFNPYPGAHIKYRLFEEGFLSPALAIGFDNQGYGGQVDADEFHYSGYVYKSPGVFMAVSKNFLMLHLIQLGFHGSLNYSFEERENVRWPNLIFGVDMGLNEELAIVAEYDLALNDKGRRGDYFKPHRGYLNLGLRWAFTPSFYIEFDAKDILQNKGFDGEKLGWGREMKIVYYSHF
ncbi:hypothetical protein CHISP_3110 [Chitinispirillum alkaliphilum]|nr:hypothetical protein CHISP_3110 [Chitinispirillum alkaliphilum]